MAAKKPKIYVAMVGLTIKGVRYEPGDEVPDPPKWMIDQGKVM